MVVVEGSSYVGGEVRVVVTSALQTSAGRMIARPQASALLEGVGQTQTH